MADTDRRFRFARFDRFSFNLDTHDLTRNGRPVSIPPQPARVLAMLLERAGALVTRDELRAALWPDRVVDFEKGLNTAVRQVRDALGESAGDTRFVETLPRRGYRFIADVSMYEDVPGPPLVSTSAHEGDPEEAEVASAPGNGTMATEGPRRSTGASRRRGRRGAVLALAGLAALAAIGLTLTTVARRGAAPARVVVLPFANLTADEGMDHVSNALSEELRTHLSGISGGTIAVYARTTSERYGDNTGGQPERDLPLDYVLEGSILEGGSSDDGGDLRVVVRLVDASVGHPVWQGEFEGVTYEGWGWRDQIGRAVADHLGVRPRDVPGATRVLALPEARQAYLEARHLLGSTGRESTLRAAERLESVVRHDPEFAPGLAALAEARLRLADLEAARSASERAIRLDPDLPEAHRVLGAVLMVGDRRLDRAGPHLELAANAPAASPMDHLAYAFYLFLSGDADAGLGRARTAYRLDPLSALLTGDVGVYHLWARQPGEAADRCSSAVELDPGHEWAHRCLVDALERQGRVSETREPIRRLLELRGASPETVHAIMASSPGEALAAFRRWEILRLEGKPVLSGADRLALARLYATRGDLGRAVASLEAAAETPPPGFPAVTVDPVFDPLRADPRFQRLVDKIWAS